MPYLLAVSLVWAFSFGLIKTHLAGVDSGVVAASRVALALLVFLPLLRPRALPVSRVFGLMAIGAVQFGVMYIAYIKAFGSLHAYQVAVLTIFTPFWVCLLEDALARTFTARAYLAAAIAVAGTGVILWTRDFGGAALTGVLLVQLSNACFALGQVLYRRWRRAAPAAIRDRDIFAWLYAGAVLATIPFAIGAAPSTLLALTTPQWATLVYLGLVASGLCFFLWNIGATRVSAATLAVMNNLKVPLAVLCSLLFFGESADLSRLITGGVFIAAALWIARDRRVAL